MEVRWKKALITVGAIITAMAGTLVLLYIAFFGAVMNHSFLRDVNIKLGIHEKLQMSEADLAVVADSMVSFTKGEQDTLQVRVTMDGEERDFYNEKEITHIEDVRELVRNVRIFVVCCAVIFTVGTVALCFKKEIAKLAGGFLISLGMIIALAAFIAVVAVNDMQAVIHGFHHMFFDNDLWLLNPTKDMVVWLFTNDIYAEAIIRIGVWLAILLLPPMILSIITVRKKKVGKAINENKQTRKTS